MEPSLQLLPKQQFDKLAAAWEQAVGDTDPTVLQAAFKSGGSRLLYGALTLESARALVANKTYYVKARFMLLADGSFAVALSGTDQAGNPTTGPFQAESATAYSADKKLTRIVNSAEAEGWLRQWVGSAKITQDLFKDGGKCLLGYDYEVADFTGALAPLGGYQGTDVNLRLYFGLRPPKAGKPAFTLLVALNPESTVHTGNTPVAYYDDAVMVPPGL